MLCLLNILGNHGRRILGIWRFRTWCLRASWLVVVWPQVMPRKRQQKPRHRNDHQQKLPQRETRSPTRSPHLSSGNGFRCRVSCITGLSSNLLAPQSFLFCLFPRLPFFFSRCSGNALRRLRFLRRSTPFGFVPF